MATAVIYYRVSDDRQVDGTSLQTQQEQCTGLVSRSGWELDSSWAEEGESAKTANRPVLQELLRYCRKNRSRIDYVVFPKIDRMARDLLDYLRVKEVLTADGIRMVSVGEKIDETPSGRFTENIMAAQAQFDNEQRAERCKGGMEAAVKREGRWVWRAPFGYENQRVSGRPNIAPSVDAATVTWIFREIAAGHSPDEVFAAARSRGLSHQKSQFYSMLSNPVYIGLIRSFGGEWSGSFAPIVAAETFRRVQVVLKRGGTTRTFLWENPDFPLKATLNCPCGKRVTGSWSKGVYAYYRCHGCGGLNLRRDDAHDRFKRFLRAHNLTTEEADGLAAAIRINLKRESFSSDRAKADMEGELARTTELQRGLALKSASGVIPDDVAKEQFQALDAKLTILRDDIRRLCTPEKLDEHAIEFGIDFVTHIDETWDSSAPELQVKLQRYLFPAGITGHKKRDFATSVSPLWELKSTLQSRSNSELVDPADASCNYQVGWLAGMLGILGIPLPGEFC